LEIRLRNALKEGSFSPTSQTLHSVVVRESLLQAAQRFGWADAGLTVGPHSGVQA
jgi:CO/xanthine dehydrogenase Mo-binding subunit